MSHRKYPGGGLISDQLPDAYRLGNASKKCSNCEFFNTAQSYCTKWSAIVKGSYLCNAWKARENIPRSSSVRQTTSTRSYGGGY